MTSLTAQPWLPAQALCRDAIESALDNVVRVWACEWFANCQAPLAMPLANGNGEGLTEQIGDEAWRLRFAQEDATAIGAACAGLVGEVVMTGKDRMLFSQVGRSALGNLVERLSAWGSGQPDFPSMPFGAIASHISRHQFHFREKVSGWSFIIDGSQSAVVSLRRHDVQQGRRCEPLAADAFQDALSRQIVNVGAHIGATRLPISATRDLAVGDVLLFDRAISDELPIAIDGCASSLCLIRVQSDATGISMRIEQPVIVATAHLEQERVI